jgi:hypothetical protein
MSNYRSVISRANLELIEEKQYEVVPTTTRINIHMQVDIHIHMEI